MAYNPQTFFRTHTPAHPSGTSPLSNGRRPFDGRHYRGDYSAPVGHRQSGARQRRGRYHAPTELQYHPVSDGTPARLGGASIDETVVDFPSSQPSGRRTASKVLAVGLAYILGSGTIAATNSGCRDPPYCDPIVAFKVNDSVEAIAAGGWTLVEKTDKYYVFRWDGRHELPDGTPEEKRIFVLPGARPGNGKICLVEREKLKKDWGIIDLIGTRGGRKVKIVFKEE